jgi:class 3 adenylate cyclase/predicted ATPase
MRCIACEHENPETAANCERCQAVLSGGSLQRVTVLCADLQGSTALAARVDAETYHEIVDGILRILPRLVHEAEGSVNQFTGDGVIAIFQGPDHTPRALMAALSIQSALREYIDNLQKTREARALLAVALNFRVGLNTGDLYVGRLGDGLRSDYAQGPTMHLAQKMESLAKPGFVFASQAVHEAVGDAFRFIASGEFEGKPIYQVDGAAKNLTYQLTERPAASYTPKHLAEAILHNRRAMEGELKEVTILFVKLLGTMTMASKLDASTCHEILEQELERMFEAVHEVEGTVNQFTGDGIMALFGAPLAHEDHVQRALAAALSIQKKLKAALEQIQRTYHLELNFRIGLNTGAVVVGKIGDDLRMDYTAKGISTNLAQRMESLASPGQIVVSEQVKERAGTLFRFRGLGKFLVKGADKEMSVYSLESADNTVTRLESSLAGNATSAFLGRSEDLSTLHSLWEKSTKSEGQFCYLVGEAGVGKSRLLYEFTKELPGVRCLTLQSLSYGNSLLYHPFRVLLQNLLGVSEVTPLEAKEKLLGLCSRYEILEVHAYFLAILLVGDVDDPRFSHLDSVERKKRVHESMRALLLSVSMEQPTILLFEDIHWMDTASRSLLGFLVEEIAEAPLLMISTARPGFKAVWQEAPHVTSIELRDLSKVEALSLIQGAFAPRRVSAALCEMLIRRASGNPLFLEELLRALQSSGLLKEGKDGLEMTAVHAGLPSTLRSLFASRLDRLDEDVKQVALTAAAFGVEAPEPLLEKVVEEKEDLPENCQELSRQAITIERLLDLQQRPYLRFTNALLQEAAYASLLRAQRQALHLKIADAIEAQSPEAERPAEMLAFHLQRSPHPKKAIPYLRRASTRARSVSALESALLYLQDALQILDNEASSEQQLRVELMLEQEQVYEALGERQQQQNLITTLFSMLRTEREVQGGPAAAQGAPQDVLAEFLPEVFLRQGDLFAQTQRQEEAQQALLTALSLQRARQEKKGEAKVLRSLGFLRWTQERFPEAIAINQEALALDRTLQDNAIIANDLNNLGTLLRYQKDYQGALAYLQEALSLYEALGNPAKQAFMLYTMAHIYRDTKDMKEATLRYHRAYDLFLKGYDLVMGSRALNALAELHVERGDLEDAVSLSKEVVRITREIKYGHGLTYAVRSLADLLVAMRRDTEAMPYLQESIVLFAKLQETAQECEARGKLANLYELRGELGQALEMRLTERALCQKIGNEPQELVCLQALARLSRRQDPIACVAYWREALRLAKNLSDEQSAANLLNSLAVFYFSQKQFGEALSHYQQAQPLYQKLGDPAKLGLLQNSICATLLRLNRFDEAVTASQAAALFNKGQKTLEGHSLAMLGDAFLGLSQYQAALDAYQASLTIRRENSDEKGAGWMLHSISRVYFQMKQPIQATTYLDEAKSIASRLGDRALQEACAQLEAI